MAPVRRILVALFILVVVIPISYYALRYENPEISRAEADAEYWSEAAQLTLAPGWNWPASPPFPEFEKVTTHVRGWGKTEADYYWFCSWASRAVDPELPAVERQEALENVLAIQTKYYFTDGMDDDAKSSFVRMLQNAVEGDADELGEFYRLNCRQSA